METDIVIDALECLEDGTTTNGKLVLHKDILERATNKGHFHIIAQFEKLVKQSVLKPEFIFLGLERGLFNDDNSSGDSEKLVYVSDPEFDYIWKGGKFGANKDIDTTYGAERETKPNNCVFTVIVSKNKQHKDEYRGVFGFIEEWSWCDSESQGKKPVDWIDRYDRLLFERSKLTLMK